VNCAQQGSSNCSVRIGIAAETHGSNNPFLQVRRVKQLPERVLQGDQNPSHIP